MAKFWSFEESKTHPKVGTLELRNLNKAPRVHFIWHPRVGTLGKNAFYLTSLNTPGKDKLASERFREVVCLFVKWKYNICRITVLHPLTPNGLGSTLMRYAGFTARPSIHMASSYSFLVAPAWHNVTNSSRRRASQLNLIISWPRS